MRGFIQSADNSKRLSFCRYKATIEDFTSSGYLIKYDDFEDKEEVSSGSPMAFSFRPFSSLLSLHSPSRRYNITEGPMSAELGR